MGRLSAFGRLCAAGAILLREGALTPHELDPLLPAWGRVLARALRACARPLPNGARAGQRLARALERCGPAAIKLGQLLSTRADIFGVVFAEDLSRLKDRLAPFPMALARAEVERGLERPLEAVFAHFDEAVAAASLAQAHPAVLHDGRKVAVKVLRPGIEARVARDSQALALAAGMIQAWVPAARRLEPKALVATVARSLALELDLRMEAAAASELGEVMARDPWMSAPAVVWTATTRRVLTLAWAEGAPLSDPAALDAPGIDRKALAQNLIRAFLAQALDYGVFHADLHEGNLFVVAPDRWCAVDFGIVGRLGPAEQRYLAEILWGFLQRDHRRTAQVHFDAGYVPRTHSVEAFAQAIRAVAEPIFGKNARDVSMGRLLTQLFEITALFDMRLRPELVLLQKTMVTVEGAARRIDPEHDIWEAARPVVARFMARELSPAARVRTLAEEAGRALSALARLAEAQSAAEPAARTGAVDRSRPGVLAAFAAGAAVAGLAFALAALRL